MNHVHAICLESLMAVIDGGDDYQTRRILRWYSREFHTPLHVVEEELPLDEVLRTFFECQFEGLSDNARLKRAVELTETEEERAEKERLAREAEASDEDFMAALVAKTAKDKKLAAPVEKKSALAKQEPAPQMGDMPEEVDIVFSDEGNLDGKEP